jgi:hypothetical protein
MSSNYRTIDATENSNSKRTLNASYTVTASAASQSGAYDFSQSYNRSHTVKNIVIFAPGLSMHYDDEWTEKSNRSTSDVGTFSPSGASGTATLNAMQSTSARRDENGSRSGIDNSTFTSHNHRGGYESQFAENKYGPNPTGKYSNNSNGSSFSQYDENGTRANGDTFSIFLVSNGVHTYNDSGTTTGSGGGLVHQGNYVLYESSGSTRTESESGTLPGGSWNATHTNKTSSSLTDDAGYTRSTGGISGSGKFDSRRSGSTEVSTHRNGSETTGAATVTFNESFYEKTAGETTDKGTHNLSPTGPSPSGKLTTKNTYELNSGGTTTTVVNGGGVNTTDVKTDSHVVNKTMTDEHQYAPGRSVTNGKYVYDVSDIATSSRTLTGTSTLSGCTTTVDDKSKGKTTYTYNDVETYGGSGPANGLAKLKWNVDGTSSSDHLETCPNRTLHTVSSISHYVNLTDNLLYTIVASSSGGGAMGPGMMGGGALAGGAGLSGIGVVTVYLKDVGSLEVTEDVSGPGMTYHREKLDSGSWITTGAGGYTVVLGQRSATVGVWGQVHSWRHKDMMSGTYCSPPPGGCGSFGPVGTDTGGTMLSGGLGLLPMAHPPSKEPVGGGGGEQGGQAAGAGQGKAGASISALDYARLSRGAYGDDGHLAKLKEEWDIKVFEDKASGFKARLFVNKTTRECVLAFAGTESSLADIRADVAQGLGRQTRQYEMAIALAGSLKQSSGCGGKLTLTGHSLGGGLAAAAALVHGLHATTFNAAGVHAATVRHHGGSLDNAGALIEAYRVRGEPLSYIQDSGLRVGSLPIGWIMPDGNGNTHWLDHPWTWKWWKWHSIDAVIDALGG